MFEDQVCFEVFFLQQGREFVVSWVVVYVILCFVWFDDFDIDYQIEIVNVVNYWVVFLQFGQFIFQLFVLGGDFVGDFVVVQMMQGGQVGGYCQLVVVEGVGVVIWFSGVELFFNVQYCQWQFVVNCF